MNTKDTLFIAHVGDPFSVAPLELVGCDGNLQMREFSLRELSEHRGPVVSFEIRTLIDAHRFAKVQLPATLIDIADALRLLSGISRTQGGEKHWDFWSFVSPTIVASHDVEHIKRLLDCRDLYPAKPELLRLLGAAAQALHHVWSTIVIDLARNDEADRFFEIETPVRQVFCQRQYLGLRLDVDAGEELTRDASRAKYTAFRELADMLGFSPAGLTFHNVGKYLQQTDASHLSEFKDSDQLEQYFKIAQANSRFADAFLRFIRASRALSVLRTINFKEGRVYPAFECIGTVTARILVVDPRLQQLPKQFRNVLAADSGKSLWYFDYSQFEPGVLAHLSGDKQFIDLYQSEDIYSSLSYELFGDATHRDLCKSIFLAYCYGMSVDRLALFLAGQNQSEFTNHYKKLVSRFFDSLPALAQFTSQIQGRLERDGYVSSLMGNKRYRTTTGVLTNTERRWALNQVVQGTASLIFKQAVLDLAERFGSEAVLLPMHDALLMQFDEKTDPRLEVEDVMIAAFQRWCPSVRPRVTVGSFAVVFERR